VTAPGIVWFRRDLRLSDQAPLTQSEKFHAAGYVREWVPELANLPDTAIDDPEEAGCRPDSHPLKIIGHREARERALAAARVAR
jgi:deoxyribodipyrimidine photo-lyase